MFSSAILIIIIYIVSQLIQIGRLIIIISGLIFYCQIASQIAIYSFIFLLTPSNGGHREPGGDRKNIFINIRIFKRSATNLTFGGFVFEFEPNSKYVINLCI
jgi:hypothetical protein